MVDGMILLIGLTLSPIIAISLLIEEVILLIGERFFRTVEISATIMEKISLVVEEIAAIGEDTSLIAEETSPISEVVARTSKINPPWAAIILESANLQLFKAERARRPFHPKLPLFCGLYQGRARDIYSL